MEVGDRGSGIGIGRKSQRVGGIRTDGRQAGYLNWRGMVLPAARVRLGVKRIRKKLFQRSPWGGRPALVERLWTLRRSRRKVHCDLYTHPAGWELRLRGKHEYPPSKVCKTADEVRSTEKRWKAMLERDGWCVNPGCT